MDSVGYAKMNAEFRLYMLENIVRESGATGYYTIQRGDGRLATIEFLQSKKLVHITGAGSGIYERIYLHVRPTARGRTAVAKNDLSVVYGET